MKRLFSYRASDNVTSFALLILRITMGALLIPHGYDKLMKFSAQSGKFTDPFGVGHPTAMALAIFGEFFCSMLVLMGLMTRFACIPPIIVMCVAIFHVHHGHFFGDGEHAALFLGGFTALLFAGPGKVSLDRLIAK